jgi:hypothetical protein
MEKMKIGGHGNIFRCVHSVHLSHSSAGYGAYFGLSIMDRFFCDSSVSLSTTCFDAFLRYYKPDCSLDEAVELMVK